MDRWKDAFKPLRQRSLRIAEQLGRPPHGGDALDSPMFPEQYGATDDIRMHSFNTEKSDDPDQPFLRSTVHKEAHSLVRGISTRDKHNEDRERGRPRRPKPVFRRSVPGTPDGRSRSRERWDELSSGGGAGILSLLLKLQSSQLGDQNRDSFISVDSDSEFISPAATPKKKKIRWYDKSNNASTSSLPMPKDEEAATLQPKKPKRKFKKKEEIKLTIHVAEVLARQKYIMQLCRALMAYGAPTHRLEEYMQMTARVLDINAQFLYLPGCMIMSFDDIDTHTAQVKLVRSIQALDLGRLAEVHNVYKNVVHDVYSVEQAVEELDQIMKRNPRYNKYLMVFLSGVASACIGPWAFEARPIDMPIIFLLGSLVGFMQYIVAPYSVTYSNVFEVTAALVTSLLSRAIGSIPATPSQPGKYMFCFSAISQSSICLILPGFAVLCSSLELQSHQIIAGSVRMVYTIIYSLFLGYGVTVGTTIYGLIDGNASSEKSCAGATAAFGNEYLQHFPFVAVYCFLAALTCQGKIKQTPVMMFFGVSAYTANYFCTKRLGSSAGVANTVGAFTIGVLGNLYSRLWHGHAATAILPGIFTIISSGLASTGSIISGLAYANAVRDGDKEVLNSMSDYKSSLSGLGLGMIQIAIGVTVGLFLSALVVYPLGKKRSGLFSF